MTATTTRNPLPLVAALLLVAGEAAVLLVIAVAELASLDRDRLALGLTTAAFFAAYGAGLLLCARGVWLHQSWARSPLVLAQLIQLGVAWSYWGATPTLAVALAVVAALVLVGLLHPASIRALDEEPEQD